MAYLYFGIVKNYLPDKGFGFLEHPVGLGLGPNKDVFFHINSIKRTNGEIADGLTYYSPGIDKICFWYVAEATNRGEQLKQVLNAGYVLKLNQENANEFIVKVRKKWMDLDRGIPFWLEEVTLGLLGEDSLTVLKSDRKIMLADRRDKKDLQRLENERLYAIRQEELKIERNKRAEQNRIFQEELSKKREEEKKERDRIEAILAREQKIKDEEFELLIAEIEPKGFVQSSQVSRYIINNRLGDKYKTISGILEMRNNESTWKFNGGFPPDIYAKLCRRLGLGHKGTNSKVVGFTSFKDL